MIDSTEQQFLRAVFCLSRATTSFSMATIQTFAGLTELQCALAVIRLGHAGLIDAERMRLTMRGLAVTAQLEEASRGERRERIRARSWLRSHARVRSTTVEAHLN